MADWGYVAAPLSRRGIEANADAVRRLLGFDDPFLPVVELLEFGLGTIAPGYHYDIAERAELGERHGAVDCTARVLMLREDVYEGLLANKGRDRFTVCHEFGHVLLHGGALNRVMRGTATAKFRDPEWQANAFASALLMPSKHLEKCKTVAEVRAEFGVTDVAARVRLRVLCGEEKDRQ